MIIDLRQSASAMRQDLKTLVEVESPSSDLDAVRACAGAVAAIGERLLGVAPEWLEVGGRPHLRWRGAGAPRVGLLCHFDTVYPLGTLAERPWREEGGMAYGPGAFDMKAGIVQGLHALATRPSLDGVEILLTSDEEVGSPTSRLLIEEAARGWRAALVMEPSHNGAIKVGRKGVSMYHLQARGRESHAGLEPEKGINALVELAHAIVRVQDLAAPSEGTTVSPTVAAGGTTSNVIPALASAEVDVRALTPAEQERVHREMLALGPLLPGAELVVTGGPNRPPMPISTAEELFSLAVRLGEELGLGRLEGAVVGGGSDGNFTAGVGTPTLDGLGAVGAGAHSINEHIQLDAMPGRAALVAALVDALI